MTNETGDMPEAAALERAAEWRMRKVDADPSDQASLRAARQMEKLAAELRVLRGSKLHLEYVAIQNWLSESDDVSELAMRVEYFHQKLGFGVWAEDGEGYLRALIEMARETAGMG
jgi:hypothetical protein